MANSANEKARSRGPVECSTDRPSAAPSYVQWVWWLLLPAVSMIEPPPRMSPLTVSVPAISTGPSRLIFGALRLTAPSLTRTSLAPTLTSTVPPGSLMLGFDPQTGPGHEPDYFAPEALA